MCACVCSLQSKGACTLQPQMVEIEMTDWAQSLWPLVLASSERIDSVTCDVHSFIHAPTHATLLVPHLPHRANRSSMLSRASNEDMTLPLTLSRFCHSWIEVRGCVTTTEHSARLTHWHSVSKVHPLFSPRRTDCDNFINFNWQYRELRPTDKSNWWMMCLST